MIKHGSIVNDNTNRSTKHIRFIKRLLEFHKEPFQADALTSARDIGRRYAPGPVSQAGNTINSSFSLVATLAVVGAYLFEFGDLQADAGRMDTLRVVNVEHRARYLCVIREKVIF